MTNAMQQG